MDAKKLIENIALGSVLKYEEIAEAEALSAEEIKAAVIDRIKRVYSLALAEERERRKATF